MQTWIIREAEAGRRLDRYVKKRLPKMPDPFLRKQLRGQGFRLNGKRVHQGDLVLKAGDQLSVYFTDEMFASFAGPDPVSSMEETERLAAQMPPILYEDAHLLAFDKPPGLLSQKESKDSLSAAEIGGAYLTLHEDLPAGFTPGLSNRLDRNTSGILLMGKTIAAQQALSEMIRRRMIEKTYYAVVQGTVNWKEPRLLVHAFTKDARSNQVALSEASPEASGKDLMRTSAKTVFTCPSMDLTLLELTLITGRSHQLRAQLSYEGFPIVGDPKYNRSKRSFNVSRQMLCAGKVTFRETLPPLEGLTGLFIEAPFPEDMDSLIKSMKQAR